MLTSSSCFSPGRSPTRSPRCCATERALLAQAVEVEVAEFLAKHVDLKTATGLRRVVRHGHLPKARGRPATAPAAGRSPPFPNPGPGEEPGPTPLHPPTLPPYPRRSP